MVKTVVCVERDVPICGDIDEYREYLYIMVIIDMINACKIIDFELIKVEECTSAKSEVVIKAKWQENEKVKESELVFRCIYQGDKGKPEVAVPWRMG